MHVYLWRPFESNGGTTESDTYCFVLNMNRHALAIFSVKTFRWGFPFCLIQCRLNHDACAFSLSRNIDHSIATGTSRSSWTQASNMLKGNLKGRRKTLKENQENVTEVSPGKPVDCSNVFRGTISLPSWFPSASRGDTDSRPWILLGKKKHRRYYRCPYRSSIRYVCPHLQTIWSTQLSDRREGYLPHTFNHKRLGACSFPLKVVAHKVSFGYVCVITAPPKRWVTPTKKDGTSKHCHPS